MSIDLNAIQARITDCQTYKFGMFNADKLAHEDAAALLAYARDLEARLGRVEALADDACAQPGTELAPVKAMGGFIRAALTATEARA